MMELAQILTALRRNADFMKQVVVWEKIPARNGRFNTPTLDLSPALLDALHSRGATRLFTHQAGTIKIGV